MSILFDLSDFPNSFTDMNGISLFVSDLNHLGYKTDTIYYPFKNFNKIFECFKTKVQQKSGKITLNNKYKLKKKMGIDANVITKIYLRLPEYKKNNMNIMNIYIHELSHFIDFMIGYITKQKLVYYSDNSCLSNLVNITNRLKSVPPKIFTYFSQFDDYNNYKTISYKKVPNNPDVYKFDGLMDILDALSLGCLFQNFKDKKQGILKNEMVIYGHGRGYYFSFNPNQAFITINRELYANYMTMSVTSEKSIELLALEEPKIYHKLLDYSYEINLKIKEIC